MQDSDKTPEHAPAAAAVPAAGGVQIARRKAILRGLGKTAAVAGAAAPLSSLASVKLRLDKGGTSYHCSASGHNSVMHSVSTAQVPVCHGKSPSVYCSIDKKCLDANKSKWPQWPTYGNNAVVRKSLPGGTAHTPLAEFRHVFGGGSATKIGELCNTGTSDEAHWVAALLNANKLPNSFPHTPEEVLKHYTDTRAAAIAFYKLVNKG